MKAAKSSTQKNEVLFQKLGNSWYVFTEVEGEMIYSALPTGIDPHSSNVELFEVVEEHMKKISKPKNNRKPEVAA